MIIESLDYIEEAANANSIIAGEGYEKYGCYYPPKEDDCYYPRFDYSRIIPLRPAGVEPQQLVVDLPKIKIGTCKY